MCYNRFRKLEVMKKKYPGKNLKIILYCFLVSFLFLMFCTKSSFLYPLNDWVDGNCFFTMGKGLFQGKVLYVDLFDQKGPLLFFYYGIASLISYHDFLGVFLLEVISFTVFLYYAYRLIHQYVSKDMSLLSLPVISYLILTLPAFTHGGSAEEFVLPFLMYGLYSLITYLKSGKTKPTNRMIFVNGICAGMVAMIKFSMLGFWFAFMMCIFFYLCSKKEWIQGLKDCVIFLIGMFLPILPWIIYFLFHNSLSVFIDSYITFNILYYPHNDIFILKLLTIIGKPVHFMAQNLGFGIPFIIGICVLFLDNSILSKRSHKWILFLTYVFLCVGVFFGGISFRYYYLILSPYLIFGVIAIAIWIEKIYHIHFKENKIAVFMIFITLLVGLSFYGSKNTVMIHPESSKKEMVQYQFATIIKKQKNPTLLNYQFLDGGFYTAAGIVPNIKYFQKQNISDVVFPMISKEQDKTIKNKKVDFVVTRTRVEKQQYTHFTKYLRKNYKPVSSKNQSYEDHKYHYILWQKK